MRITVTPLPTPPPVVVLIELDRDEARLLSRIVANTVTNPATSLVNALSDELYRRLKDSGIGVGVGRESPFILNPTFKAGE